MYANPVLLPQFSNREDLLLTISIFDDDTGQPVDLAGVKLALPQNFTAAAWTVTDGAIITTSATQITIPYFPQGSQLSALSLIVGVGLAIAAGDPITIKDTATGLNSMTGFVISYAGNTGALVVQIGKTFQFEIRKGRPGDGRSATASPSSTSATSRSAFPRHSSNRCASPALTRPRSRCRTRSIRARS
jgi:hypothetical protein